MTALLKNKKFTELEKMTRKSLESDAIPIQEKSSLKIFELEKLEWLTTEEAANYLKIPIGTLRNWTSNGRITFYKLGRSNRYLLSDLVKFLLKNKRGDLTYGN